MAAPIVDPSKFLLLVWDVDWSLIYQRDAGQLPPPQQVAAERGLQGHRLVQLRWVMDPALGYPTEPFTVWRRTSQPASDTTPVDYRVADFMGATLIVFDRPQVLVRVRLQGSSGTAAGFAGRHTPRR